MATETRTNDEILASIEEKLDRVLALINRL